MESDEVDTTGQNEWNGGGRVLRKFHCGLKSDLLLWAMVETNQRAHLECFCEDRESEWSPRDVQLNILSEYCRGYNGVLHERKVFFGAKF